MKPRGEALLLGLALILLGPGIEPVRAGVGSRAAKEAIERAGRWIGREAGEESSSALARRGERAAARVVGSTETREAAARFPARHGDDAARIARDPARLAPGAWYGDEAAAALIRHPALAGPLVESLGKPGARALAKLDARNARRLAILAGDGTLERLGRTEEVLDVIGRYGDRAMEFVWRHKGAVTVGTFLAAFLSDPGPFLSGGRELGSAAAEAVAASAGELPGAVLDELKGLLGRLAVVLACFAAGILGGQLAWRRWRAARQNRT